MSQAEWTGNTVSVEMHSNIKEKYWIIIESIPTIRPWQWKIKCINGKYKAMSYKSYSSRSLCVNDAKTFAEYTGLKIRF